MWLKNLDKPLTKDNIRIFHFARISFRVVASSSLLATTIRHHQELYKDSDVANDLLLITYLDKVLLSATNKEEAVKKSEKGKKLFQLAGMDFCEVTSSSAKLRERWQGPSGQKDVLTRILGVTWSAGSDQIFLTFKKFHFNDMTKRTLLSLDAINVKLQFAYDILKDQANYQFKEEWKGVCELLKSATINVKVADPATAAKILLQGEEFTATRNDKSTLLVFPCKRVNINIPSGLSFKKTSAINPQNFVTGPLPPPELQKINLA